jgi:chemosensory pili system protein ChpA (sensor histidine kinase/response regulator)
MDQSEQAFLRSVFLMEAWDAVGAMEGALGALSRAERPTIGADHPLLMLAHKLHGSAAVHGLTDVAGLAATLEERVTRVVGDRTPALDPQLGDIVDAIKRGLDDVGRATSTDDGSSRWPGGDAASADILDYFAAEAAEHLETMTRSLLALEQEPSEVEVATLFRAVHTLKGAALTVGCGPVGELAHRIEDVIMAVRDGLVPLSTAVVEAVFAGTDALRVLLAQPEDEPERLATTRRHAEDALVRLLPAANGASLMATPVDSADPPPEVALPPALTFDEDVAMAAASALAPPAAMKRPAQRASIRVGVDRLDALMAVVGELVIARRGLEGRLSQLDRVADVLLASRTRLIHAVGDFERKYEYTQLPLGKPAQHSEGPALGSPAPRGAALGRRGPGASEARSPQSGRALDRPPEFWSPAPRGAGFGRRGPGASEARSPQSGRALDGPPEFTDLELDRYDDFNILARSLAEISADVSEGRAQLANLIRSVRDDAGHIRRLTAELRADVTRARMVPIGTLFARFARPAREAAKAAGRRVLLQTSGESAELDNAIIEQIADPVLHLVQNAVWHGIEPPSERELAGKPAAGTVQLNARHRGSFIYVEVEDDGRGIDVETLESRAVAKGLMRPDEVAALTRDKAVDLIFLPGLSTADSVSIGAGRGVGMDVVRTNVSRLNGEIVVETEAGVGTRVTLKLPLTVVISDALLVRVGEETLAVPQPAIRRILTFRDSEVQRVGGTEFIEVDGEWLDFVRLDAVLGLTARSASRKTAALVLRAGGRSLVVTVDELLHKEEIVIKGLGEFLDGVGPFSGTTISGDGRLILVIDPSRLRAGPRATSEAPVAPAHRRVEAVSRAVVLLVDDSVSVRKVVGGMLARAGFTVHTAVDGADALEQLGERRVDVVVTDLELPRLNGYELIEAMRRRPATRDLPVIVLSSRSGEKHVLAARRLGVDHHVTKPVNEAAFVRLVSSLADAPRATAAENGRR